MDQEKVLQWAKLLLLTFHTGVGTIRGLLEAANVDQKAIDDLIQSTAEEAQAELDGLRADLKL